MILGAEEADLLTQVNDDKPKSAERSPFEQIRILKRLTFAYKNGLMDKTNYTIQLIMIERGAVRPALMTFIRR